MTTAPIRRRVFGVKETHISQYHLRREHSVPDRFNARSEGGTNQATINLLLCSPKRVSHKVVFIDESTFFVFPLAGCKLQSDRVAPPPPLGAFGCAKNWFA